MNNLYQIEKNLRSIARRYKEVKFSISLAIIFLMLGVRAFGEEKIDSNIQKKNILTRSQIKENVESIQESFTQLKQKNDFLIKEMNLELIQLMEQGDQVIKSPWSSWQFGMNYVSHNWSGGYKGRGDKDKNYPYEGIFTRSEDIFERYVSSSSPNYKKINKRNRLESYEYGITKLKKEEEPVTEWEISPNVNPQKIKEQTHFTLVLNHKVDFQSPSLPTFAIPDERVEIEDIVPRANTPISGTSLNLTYSKKDVTHILQDDSNIIVGGIAVDKVGPISQTDIRGKNGKGKIEFIHDNILKFSVETKNTTFIGKEGSDHHTVFTYENDISGKYSYQGTSAVGPLGIRVGGGHNFSIENTDITSSGTLRPTIEVLSPPRSYRNIFLYG